MKKTLLLLAALSMLLFPLIASADIVLPESLVVIDDEAFSGCPGLSGTLIVPEGVTEIGEEAFADCDGLTELILPPAIQTIEDRAFAGCTALAGTVVDSGVQVGEDAFDGTEIIVAAPSPAEDFEYAVNADGTVTVTKYIGSCEDGVISIPPTFEDKPVTVIGEKAFYMWGEIKTVFLPSGIKEIGKYAFAYCSGLQSVHCSDSPVSFGYGCFMNCGSLRAVYGAQNAVSYGDGAFQRCTALSEMRLNQEAESWGQYAFYQCSQLTATLLLSAENVDLTRAAPFCDSNILAFVFSANGDSATLEACYAWNSERDSVAFPSSFKGLPVTAIAERFFQKWASAVPARKVILPEKLITIANAAFMQTDVDEVVLPASLESVADNAFLRSTVKTINLPKSLKAIGNDAFMGCANLTSITLPDNLETIGTTPFRDSGITSVNVPASWTELPPYCFYGMSLTEFTIPARITAIGQCALADNAKLTSIVIPETVTTFGAYLLSGCTSLTDVTLPNTMTTLPTCAFANCTSLTSIDLPDSITSFGLAVFEGCTSLEYVELPPNLTHIPTCAFNNSGVRTKAVEKVVAQCITDDMSAFEKALALHDWLTEHADYSVYRTFFGAEGVLVYGEGVCQSYTDAYAMLLDAVGIPVKPVVSTPMDHTWNLVQLGGEWYHIDVTWDDPVGGTETHQYFGLSDALMSQDHTWDNPSELPAATGTRYQYGVDNRPGEPEVAPSPAEDFEYAVNADGTVTITKYIGSCEDGIVSIPPTFEDKPVTVIGEDAFRDNSEIQTVYCPETTVTIGIRAFSGCTALKAIYGTKNVTEYQNLALAHSPLLSSLAISPDVRVIGDRVFWGTQLDNVLYIPEDRIGNGITSYDSFADSHVKAILYRVNADNTVTITGIENDNTPLDLTLPSELAGCPVTEIGEQALYWHKQLTHIDLPQTVTKLGANAFGYCTALTSVTGGESVTYYGDSVFAGCEALADLYINQRATYIGGSAFSHCSLSGTLLLDADCTVGTNPFASTDIYGYAFSVNGQKARLERLYTGGTVREYETLPASFRGMPVTAIAGDFAECGYGTAFPGKHLTIPACVEVIDAHAFNFGDDYLLSVTIEEPSALTTIGQSAFSDAKLLDSINLPESVTTIEEGAFYGCGSLTEITLPDGLANLGVGAFRYTDITAINLPACWRKIPDNAFEDMPLKMLEIPEQIISIGDAALAGTDLTSIVVPDWVTYVGSYAFQECENLVSAEIYALLPTLPDQIFFKCTSLERVVLPDSIFQFGLSVFRECPNLEYVALPKSLTMVPTCAFQESGVRTAAVERIVAECITEDMSNFEKALALHDWLTTHADYSSKCTFFGAEGVLVYGEGVCSSYAEAYAMLLDRVGIISKPVISEAMDHSWNLVRLGGEWYHVDCTWDDPVGGTENHQYFGLTDELMAQDHTWDNPESLPEATGTRYQYGVDHTPGEPEIEPEPEEPDEPEDIEEPVPAANPVDGYEYAVYPTSGNVVITRYIGEDTVVTIPESINGGKVTEIGASAFGSNPRITSVTIPETVRKIGAFAFDSCGSLTSVSLPESLRSIGECAFAWCNALTSIRLPDGLKEADRGAFQYSGVTSVNVPAAWTEIPAGVFSYMPLTSITIPDHVTGLGESAFIGTSLTAVQLPDTLKSIGPDAFRDCVSLTAIRLPDNLETLGMTAFYGSGITSINVPASWTEIPAYAFTGMAITQFTIPSHITRLGLAAFSETKLTSLVIPDTVTEIGDYILSECKALTSITFPKGMTTIPTMAFYGCTGLTGTLVIPEGVTDIGDRAFEGCTNLEYVELPPGVTFIPYLTFNNSGVRTKAVEKVVAQCTTDGMSDFEMALALHDWLTEHADYSSYRTFHGAEGVLVYGEGVCQSYTEAYTMLLTAVGIPVKTVMSTSMDHSWNLVQLDEEWYHVDCTWNDPINGMERHIYFGLTDELMGEDHTWDDPPSLPAATGTRYQYGVDNGAK